MSNNEPDKALHIPGYLQGLIAAAGGVTAGMASAVKATQTEFRKKILEYMRHNIHPLPGDKPVPPELQKVLLKQNEGELTLHEQLDAHGIALENATTRQLNHDVLNLNPADKEKAVNSYLNEAHVLKNDFTNKLHTISERLGIETKGMKGLTKGTWQKFKYMGGETQNEIVFDVVLATLIGAAGTLMFTNSINTHNKLNANGGRQKKILENQQRILDALDQQQRA